MKRQAFAGLAEFDSTEAPAPRVCVLAQWPASAYSSRRAANRYPAGRALEKTASKLSYGVHIRQRHMPEQHLEPWQYLVCSLHCSLLSTIKTPGRAELFLHPQPKYRV